MTSFLKAGVVSALLFLTAQTLPVALAAPQGRERRVFTNEDVERPAPAPAPASTAEGQESEAALSQTQEEQTPTAQPAGPAAELKKALEFQTVIKEAFAELVEKSEVETNPALKERWDTMADCLSLLVQNNQRTIFELEAQLQQEQQEQPSSQ